jgi:signal transduction histidine kinase
VLQRLTQLSMQLVAIGDEGVLSARLPVRRRDEIGVVAGAVNEMLGAMERAQAAMHEVEALRAIDRAKNEFIAVFSHELLTPLTSILGWAEQGQMARSPEEVQQALTVILRNARRQQRVLNTLIDVSKIVYGKLPLNRVRIELWKVLAPTIARYEVQATARGAHFTVESPAVPLPVEGDPIRLTQAIENVLKNAVKFTPSGGRITISAFRAGPRISLTVQDSGSGITSERMERLFRPFEQLERDEAFGGLGLGLYFARAIVELHGGIISASSPGVGQGSTFTIELPVDEGVSQPAKAMR